MLKIINESIILFRLMKPIAIKLTSHILLRMSNFCRLLLFFLLLLACKGNIKEQITTKELSEVLAQKTTSISLIDSLLEVNTYTNEALALLHLEKGKVLNRTEELEKSLIFFEKGLSLLDKKRGNKSLIAETYTWLGITNSFLSKREIANEQFFKALELSRDLHDMEMEADIYSQLSYVYFLYSDYETSIDYTLKAIETQAKAKDSAKLSGTYNNLAVIYRNIKELDSALAYNKKSLELNIKIEDESAVAKSYNNLGLVLEELNRGKEAEEYYLKAIEINKKERIQNPNPNTNLGNYYRKIKVYGKAEKYLKTALSLAQKTGAGGIKKQREIYNDLLSNSIQSKNFENSLRYQQKRDSLSLIETRFDNEAKLKLIEDQNELIISEKALEEEKKINDKNRVIFLILFLFFSLAALIIYLRNKNIKLKLEQEKLQLEQTVLRSQMNPHFIFNALSAIQNTLLDNDPVKSATYLSGFARLMRQNFDFIKEEQITLNDELDALQNYMNTQQLRFKEKFCYRTDIAPGIDTETIKIPPLLIQPFVENAIEHGFKNKKETGEIILKVSQNNNSVCYEIRDNGNGYLINRPDNKEHAIEVLKKRIKLLKNGDEETFKISSSSKGTTVNFCLKS